MSGNIINNVFDLSGNIDNNINDVSGNLNDLNHSVTDLSQNLYDLSENVSGIKLTNTMQDLKLLGHGLKYQQTLTQSQGQQLYLVQLLQ